MKNLFPIFFVFLCSAPTLAEGLSVQCDEQEISFSISTFHSARETYEDGEWSFTISGETPERSSIDIVSDRIHRHGVAGYAVTVREAASPLSPRTVYQFITRDCFEKTALLRIKRGAGTREEKPVSDPIPCQCDLK